MRWVLAALGRATTNPVQRTYSILSEAIRVRSNGFGFCHTTVEAQWKLRSPAQRVPDSARIVQIRLGVEEWA
jgi:hypothetical protein